MASAPAGQVTVEVIPDITGFSEKLQQQLVELEEQTLGPLLTEFAEWIDGEQMLRKPWCGGDARGPEKLVTDYLAARRAKRDAEKDDANDDD